VFVRIAGCRRPLSTFSPSIEDTSADNLRIVEVASPVAELTALLGFQGLPDENTTPDGILSEFNKILQQSWHVCWDLPVSELEDVRHVKGILVRSTRDEPEHRAVLLVHRSGGEYVRVGIMWPNQALLSSGVRWQEVFEVGYTLLA